MQGEYDGLKDELELAGYEANDIKEKDKKDLAVEKIEELKERMSKLGDQLRMKKEAYAKQVAEEKSVNDRRAMVVKNAAAEQGLSAAKTADMAAIKAL